MFSMGDPVSCYKNALGFCEKEGQRKHQKKKKKHKKPKIHCVVSIGSLLLSFN